MFVCMSGRLRDRLCACVWVCVCVRVRVFACLVDWLVASLCCLPACLGIWLVAHCARVWLSGCVFARVCSLAGSNVWLRVSVPVCSPAKKCDCMVLRARVCSPARVDSCVASRTLLKRFCELCVPFLGQLSVPLLGPSF